jgi:peptidoglycan hydrolase-like protein with peptidoglycan-binding domain
MPIRSSVGQGGINLREDVSYVQGLLNRMGGTGYNHGTISVDGINGPQTIAAIKNYQQNVVKLSRPDGRVDPGGKTILSLEQNAVRNPMSAPVMPPPPPPPTTGTITLTFAHGNKRPTATGAAMYESTITLSGGMVGSFVGSIYPDNMAVKGRVKDGTYDLSLTFHRKNGIPTAKDLIVKEQGDLRPALTLNNGNSVPVISDNPSKTTSSGINVHNGFNSNRGSEGCLTLKPTDWSRFNKLFLTAYPNLSDWYAGNGSWLGKKLGQVVIKA